MGEMQMALLASVLAVAFLAAAFIGRRAGDSAPDVRLLLGTGAALGGLALVLLSTLELT